MTEVSSTFSPQDDPDVLLMLQVRDGNAYAFEELMRRYQTRVHSLLQNMMGNWQLAEDLTQEVFLRVYRARESYTPDAPFPTWIYRIVHNLALNALRKKQRHPELLFSGAPASESADSSGASSFVDNFTAKSGQLPTRELARKEIQEVVRKAIDQLGERQRLALLLHRFERMNYQQIADIMQLSPKAVKSLLCRARLNLKEILKPYVEEGRNIQ